MHLNYFYNSGSHPLKDFEKLFLHRKIMSFWNSSYDSVITPKKITPKESSLHSQQSYFPLQKFFSDSLYYSINTMQEIKEDLVINPVSPNFDKTVIKSNFSLKKFLTIGLATIALQLGVTALHNYDSSDNISNNIAQSHLTTSMVPHDSAQNTIFLDKYITTQPVFLKHNKVNYLIPFTDFLQKSISQSNPVESIREQSFLSAVQLPKYMQSMFTNKTEAFLYLLKVAEGKQNRFYPDNKGIAIAYGWNPTRNTHAFNLQIAQEAGLDEQQIAAILKISDTNKVNFVPKDLKNLRLSPEQVQKTAIALMPHYEQSFLDAMSLHSIRLGRDPIKDLSAYYELPNNQQAVMIHMAYKVGGENLVNYKTFYKKLFSYLDKPTKANLSQVQKNFQYTYATLDGERLHDSRVEEIHTGFFSDCSIASDPKIKEKVSTKINQCRNIANLTNKESVSDLRQNVAGIQSKMAKIFG